MLTISEENKFHVGEFIDLGRICCPSHYPKGPAKVIPLFDGNTWVLMEEFYVDLSKYGYDPITIPKGFVFDFASIPQYTRTFFQPATGKHRYAALVHDYLYTVKTLSRKDSDKIFELLMKLDGTPYILRKTMYRAVRVFGKSRF